jgi:hypothetical protein
MAYSDFTLTQLLHKFNLKYEDTANLFATVPKATISLNLQDNLEVGIPLAQGISTEKARSEFIVAPILLELKKIGINRISMFSGSDFTVEAQNGLNGVCDYILSKSKIQSLITAPIVMIVEAKNENIKAGLGQCGAAMLAAQKFNENEGNLVPVIYGVVTSGETWRFLKLEGIQLYSDEIFYHIRDVEKIFGILLDITGLNLAVAA